MGARTNVDDTAARTSALDQWVASVHREFIEAQARSLSEPARTFEILRKVVEAWVHAMLTRHDPTFNPYDRRELRTEQLSHAIERIKPHLPPELQNVPGSLAKRCNPFHHNTGQPQVANPHSARAALIEAASLVEFLHTQIDVPAPNEVMRLLNGLLQKPVSAPAQPTLGLAPIPRERVPLAASTQPSTRTFAKHGAFAVLVLVGLGLAVMWFRRGTPSQPAEAEVVGSGSGNSPKPADSVSRALAWVDRYEADIASQDVERVVRNMRFPMKSFFGRKDASETFVRDQTAKWFTNNTNTKTFFDNCREGTSPAKERYAVRCDVRLEPALREALAPQCFVFDGEGLLVSRTDSNSPASCPP